MFVIYHKETTLLLNRRTYETEAAAKAAITRHVKKENMKEDGDELLTTDFGIANKLDFHAMIEKQVERTNLMSGRPFVEPINTPVYCSPACNSYWEM